MPTLKGAEASFSYAQCFFYLVSSSINVSILPSTWLETFWTDLVCTYINSILLVHSIASISLLIFCVVVLSVAERGGFKDPNSICGFAYFYFQPYQLLLHVFSDSDFGYAQF